MNKIKSFAIQKLRNNEDYTFQKSFADMAKKYLTENNMISTAVATHANALIAFDIALNKLSGISKAVLATEADAERDQAWSGANAYLYALANFCPDNKMKTAAFEIYTLFEKFGNPTRLGLSAESSVIQNLIDSIQMLPGETISDCGFTLWYNTLVSKQNQFVSATNTKNSAEAAVIVGNVKDSRNSVDNAYRSAIAVINAVASIQPTDKIATFIAELNNLIDEKIAILKARKTMAENAEDAAPIVAVEQSQQQVTE